jgi:predicted site-specific integrase-resolvase
MENIFTVGKAAQFLKVKVQTLQKWDREGKLKPASRTATNRRVYTEKQLLEFLNLKVQDMGAEVLAYCRVSSQAQKPDLKNQQEEGA